ncbi:unnamed protein product [Arctogadus glacialis]
MGMDALWEINHLKTKTTSWWLHRSPCEATAMVNTSSSSLGKPFIFSPCMGGSYCNRDWEMKDLDVDVILHPGGDQPTERPAPQLSPRRERGNSDRGGTLVGGTFCGDRDEEIQATAQGHAGSTEGPCLEIRHSETSEAQRRLWRKENPGSELFNGSQIPIPK